ncbi:NAD(P)/FAD-dependent oxidoreductase [Rhodococcus triatomae]|uniref:Predicted flavoprotein CzcO associated with the cation diffusion facilitator CzcD n=1 Tax=Rhodococcus triatomae TaxID=300028 RepID=A0A1G8PPX2_9NOCA|nr:NAD(P)/FAD-dependent oxidoreductase [Rhodococcus triatomae]QNG20154.1 NAD(P)/FAD-dependent oxidoreductase [Rhodococcus triatomae]QNG23930.1 NAD(P)/FAD-dependent oxidoreductase [Rhodococcus triatomae]SDI93920.1 Predicted flavoprotein CzcO associated with the cation diffusion facilitator CzcD [Rhodococcus triatomae]
MERNAHEEQVDAVVVGAGIAGLYAIHRLRRDGLTVRGIEAGSGVGGTWYFNRYPGARCDVESVDYSYSFSEELQQDWDWSEKYATQPEILRYIEHVAERFDLAREYLFDTRVVSADFDAGTDTWTVRTDRGDVVRARFCVFATGSLSAANTPDIAGRDEFAGETFHTAHWPHEGVDFTGKRVGVIGTGSSGIQSIPLIAQQAEQLYVFQRTANYSVPAGNQPLDEQTRRQQKANYAERRRLSRLSGGGSPFSPRPVGALEVSEEERRAAYEERWRLGGVLFAKTFPDQTSDLAANETARQFAEEKIRELVDDPEVAELLIPKDHPIGTKRIVTDSDYFQTYNRDNVTLVDLRSTPIERIDPTGIATSARHYDLDAIVFATGFDALTGSLDRIDIRGRDGRLLRESWSAGPRTYLGLGVDGFPNLFLVTGAGSPSVLANMILGAEQHVDWIADCIRHLDEHGYATIEPTVEAVEDWLAECAERASKTLFPTANSWYMGANIPGKPRVFMLYLGGFGNYGRICTDVAEAGYKGFTLTAR